MQKHIDTIEWATGIFEGEGNIYRRDDRRLFIMSVQMKDEDIIKRFYKVVVRGKVIKRRSYRGYAPMWEWRLTRTNHILELANIFLPYMGERRTVQIEKAIKNKVLKNKPRRKLKPVPECDYMLEDEVSSRGAKMHIRKGEQPCLRCAKNQREYLRQWRNRFYEVNK